MFAVPGCFDDPLSAGCHALLKQGAHVATSAEDILQEFGQSEIRPDAEQNIAVPATKLCAVQPGEDNSLLSLCKNPISMDELEQKTGLSLVDLQTALFDLQLEGKVIQNFMGMWQTQ